MRYEQDWPAYNLAQQNEKSYFKELLSELVQVIRNPVQTKGRPRALLSDIIYSMIFKVYCATSGRRFASDLKLAEHQGLIDEAPHYNTMFVYFQKENVTELLRKLVQITSAPLKAVESKIAIDSTGFGTNKFQRWFDHKYGKKKKRKQWVKVHAACGTKTNIVTAVKITTEWNADAPQYEQLVDESAELYDFKRVLADKAYLSKHNLNVAHEHGATPFIPFKSNSKKTGNGMVWKRMYHYFELNNELFMKEYHQRSNVETTFHMIKAKFGDSVRSKDWTAQVNEVLRKIICHNICVVIQEMHELGIKPEFFKH